MKPKYVMDASAFLALINGEKGSEIARKYLSPSCISAVNVAEIVSVLSETKVPESDCKHIIKSLISEIIPFNEKQAYVCGRLREYTRSKGLSLGDRACLSLAMLLEIPTVTADTAWSEIDLGVQIIQIR